MLSQANWVLVVASHLAYSGEILRGLNHFVSFSARKQILQSIIPITIR